MTVDLVKDQQFKAGQQPGRKADKQQTEGLGHQPAPVSEWPEDNER